MILGLGHIGVTVKELDESLRYYRETFGFEVLSDAERKGEWIDKITGIPGFHTRTVYLTVAPYRQLELFGFFHPKTLPAEIETAPRVGIPYCVLLKKNMGSFSELAETGKAHGWSDLMGDPTEEPYRGCRVVTSQDPNGLTLRIVEQRNEQTASETSLRDALFYPVLIVENMESSVQFYQDALGLEVASQGDSFPEVNAHSQNAVREPLRWVLFDSPTGHCLKLIQPLNTQILPAHPWRMERIGFSHVAFAIKDLERYSTRVKEKGISFKSPPQSVTVGPHKGGKAVYFSAPEGITLEFIESPLTLEEAAKI